MTAVVPGPAYQSLPRDVWRESNDSQQPGPNGVSTSADDPKMNIPRKSAQRSNSSSSVTTTASTASTVTAHPTQQSNGPTLSDATWARKRPSRGIWPPIKSDPVSTLSAARPAPLGPGVTTPSATTPLTPIQGPTSSTLQQNGAQGQWQQNGPPRAQTTSEHPAILHLLPINGTFDSKTITVPYAPEILRIGRQTNQKTMPTSSNGYFDSKVLSRQHAEIWADREGKIWIRDVKSSNGTFVNGKRLSQENRDSEPHLLKEQDVLELGIDIVSEDQKTVVHHKVAARVEHAGFYGLETSTLPMASAEMDQSPGGTTMQQPGGTVNKPRSSSQGSNASNRSFPQGSSVAGSVMAPPGYHPKWLQPISMEQIVKRINFELRNARQVSTDLTLTSGFVDAVGNEDKSLSATRVSSPTTSFDGRSLYATPPPGPPPTAPLPEPPEAGLRSKLNNLPTLQPMLRRTETERPKTATPGSGRNSPIKIGPNVHIRSLIDALHTAQKEISSQSEKIKEVEENLRKERQDRILAEERFAQTKTAQAMVSTQEPDFHDAEQDPSSALPPDVERLQSLVEAMRIEMEEMKIQIERYRQRAEGAEEECQRNRESLADMVESIRRREELVRRRKSRKRAAKHAGNMDEKDPQHTASEDEELEALDKRLGAEVERAVARLNGASSPLLHTANGSATSPVSVSHLQELGKAAIAAVLPQSAARRILLTQGEDVEKERQSTDGQHDDSQLQTQGQAQRSRTREQLVHSAPYASIIGVVLLGVGMMAYLNGWQKVVER